MGFLLGAFGKLAAGRRVRDLQARMMRVQSKLRRTTRQIESMSKMLESQKKFELNSLTMQNSMMSSMMMGTVQGQLGLTAEQMAAFTGAGTSGVDAADKGKYFDFQQAQTEYRTRQEMWVTQMKQSIEDRYENLNDVLLEPLKQEEDSLQTEKDSLESQVQIAQADYEACKKMEQADAKNLAPNYTGQG